ncbi:hypothetical protein ABVN23_29190 [Pseudomonas fluorescens]|uniref:hypothetical protein n=1 Tax=Pseudomonas fluorescens TaxID=294 RepID=UPI003F9CE221
MSQPELPVATLRCSRKDPVAVVCHQSAQCYFRPDTEELIFIDDDHAGKFELHWQEMNARMDAFHRANANYSTALERYAGAASKAALPPGETEKRQMALTEAEQALEKSRAAIKKELGDFSLDSMSYDEVIELIPVVQGKGGRNGKSKPYAYVKKGYFSQTQAGRKLHNVSLKGKDKRSAQASIYSKDKNGKTVISSSKLAEQLTALEWPKIKLELRDVLKWAGSDFDLDKLKSDFVLFDWAESWNHSQFIGTKELTDSLDLSRGAQFMRFASNVGASGEFDVAKGTGAFKGEANAALTVSSGKVSYTAYVPDRLGWALRYTDDRGNDFNMGLLRLCLTPELTGFVGASVQIEGQLQIARSGDQQVLMGQPGGRLPRFHERKTRGVAFHQQMAAEDEGLSVTAQAFAGARVEGSLKGSLQWLKPTPPRDLNPNVAGLLQSTGKYTDFCTIGSSIAGLAGAGAGGKFYCTFINGKFCFHVAASLCWGVGAKGGVICEVGTNTIAEFGAWLIYQLYRLDFGFFDLVDVEAFKAYSQYCVMQMASMGEDLYELYGRKKSGFTSIAAEYKSFMEDILGESTKGMEASKRRNHLARHVNSDPERLLRYTPESKGMLLYLLTRHGVWDHLDYENHGDGFVLDIYSERKESVIWVLKSIQTVSEWRKVMCRMTRDGRVLAGKDGERVAVVESERHLERFLQEGISRDDDMYKAKAELVAIYQGLKSEIAWGYALAMNDTAYYQLNSASNFYYPGRCSFGPCEGQLVDYV